MKMYNQENGVIVIEGDDKVIELVEGEDLSAVDISDYRLTSDNLADLYNVAIRRKDVESAKKYAALKEKYLNTFSA
jgi:hypothetical protein